MNYAKSDDFSMSNARREQIAEEIMGYGVEPENLLNFIQSVTVPGFLLFSQNEPTKKAFPAALVEWLELKMPGFEESLTAEAVSASTLDPAAPGASLFGETITRKAQDSVLCFLHEQLANGLAGVHAILHARDDYAAQGAAVMVAMKYDGIGYFSGRDDWVFGWVRWNLRRGWDAFQKEEAATKKNPPARGGNAGDGQGPELTPRP